MCLTEKDFFFFFLFMFLLLPLAIRSGRFRLQIRSTYADTACRLHLAKSARFFGVGVFRVQVHKCVHESVLGQAPVSK